MGAVLGHKGSMEPPQKKRRPEVPLFFPAAPGPPASSGGASSSVSVAAVAAADKAERRAEAELERRRKAGLPVPDPTPPRHVADQVTPSAPSVPSAPSKTPAAEAGSSLGPTPRLPDVSGVDPAALHAALAMGPDVPGGKSSGVYGFAGAKASEAGTSK